MSLRLSICGCGHDGGLPARSYAIALSPPGSFAVSRSIAIGLPAVVFLLPPHRMSDELVKTARADRSSVKPLQFIPIPSRLRSGCLMMCPTGCLPSASCAAPSYLLACRCLIRSAHPFRSSPRRACRASALCPPACLVSTPRSVMLTHRVCPSRLIRSSAHPLIRFAHPPRSASPPRLSCRRAGRHHLAFISSCVSPAASAFRLSSSRCAYRYTECCGDGDRRMWGIRASVP